MATVSEVLAVAVQHHQAGRWQAAEEMYRQVLAADPNEAKAWHLLGVLNAQRGRHQAGVECIGRALAITPDWGDALSNLGQVLAEQGRFDEAAACQRRVIELQPGDAQAYNRLGRVLQAQGKIGDAVTCYRQALELNPDLTAAYVNLGVARRSQGSLDEAASCYRHALRLEPDHAVACNNLGSVCLEQGKVAEAVTCFRRALELRPTCAEAHDNLGVALRGQAKFDEAAACHRRALDLSPDFVSALRNLGLVLQLQGKLDEAVAFHRRALELCPDLAAEYDALGLALRQQEKLDEAVACHQKALQLKPDFAEAYYNLGIAFKDRGELDESLASFRRAVELKPDLLAAHSGLLYVLSYHPRTTPSDLAAAHAEYDRLHAQPLRSSWRRHENLRNPSRSLRLGFVSRDFRRQPTAYFVVPCLEALDREQFETVCYYDCGPPVQDEMTIRFRSAAAAWREVAGQSDEQLAEQIHNDRIDILFDLAGHTAPNRLMVFARRPAPIQITWAGYLGTTGLEAMDFILADRWTIPAGMEGYYRERVLRMPNGYICYDPPPSAPDPGPLPAATRRYVRFGSFNSLAKITPQVVEVWAEILRRVPQSRLMLKYGGLGDPNVCERYRGMFTAIGVEPQRLEFASKGEYADYLAALRQLDIALDPFPFAGGVTTCNTIWMGVPVVACPGETFAGRHGLSYLMNIGLAETVAGDLQQYVGIAVALAGDLPRLAALRAGLRERMAASPLCDAKRFARSFADVLRGAWREWCGCPGPSTLDSRRDGQGTNR